MKIDIDEEVFLKLKEVAEPFVDMTPNHVIRRLLGLPPKPGDETIESPPLQRPIIESPIRAPRPVLNASVLGSQSLSISQAEEPVSMGGKILIGQGIDRLRGVTTNVHSAFLTFLMDKYLNEKGNYKTSDIIPFFERFNLVTPSGFFLNPWMDRPYENKSSCQRTVEHFRQCRKFGCWGGKNSKANCDKFSCEYHPDNNDGPKNKCDFRKGVIWRREAPQYPSCYGERYIEVVKTELLKGKVVPLKRLLSLFYPDDYFDEKLIAKFIEDFHMNKQEMTQFFE